MNKDWNLRYPILGWRGRMHRCVSRSFEAPASSRLLRYGEMSQRVQHRATSDGVQHPLYDSKKILPTTLRSELFFDML